MVEQFKADEEINSLLIDMKGIAAVYENVKATQDKPATSDKDIISVGNNTSYKLSSDQLKAILEKVTVLRFKITQ